MNDYYARLSKTRSFNEDAWNITIEIHNVKQYEVATKLMKELDDLIKGVDNE